VPKGFLFWTFFACALFLVPALDHSPYFLSELMLFGMYFAMVKDPDGNTILLSADALDK